MFKDMVANPGTHCAKTEWVQQSPDDIPHPAEIIQNDISGLPQQNQRQVEQSDDNVTKH